MSGLLFCVPVPAQPACDVVQITDTVAGTSRAPSLDGGSIAFVSSADLTGGNPDGNQEIFLATCPLPTTLEVPTLHPLALAALALLLLAGGWWRLRRA